jgi:MPBQ/MSBQ methyltransferase
MASTSGGVRDNRSLRFYHEVLGLERLNYGLWNADDELTFENLKRAQLRYEDHLVGLIPEGVRRILDVGCGTGVMTSRLVAAGYEAEGLSPSPAQEQAFWERCDAPFHLSTFQDFRPSERFDCLMMSESAQYVPLEQLFPKVTECLPEGGSLVLCDYFTMPGAEGEIARSGHPIEAFRQAADDAGFRVVEEHDLTERAARTLELATDYVGRVDLAIELGTDRLRRRRPVTYRLVRWAVGRATRKLDRQRPLIDPALFRTHKRYLSFLFER